MKQWLPLAAAGAALFVAQAASAQEGGDFFKGKTVSYIVATSPGSGYDTYGRLVGRSGHQVAEQDHTV